MKVEFTDVISVQMDDVGAEVCCCDTVTLMRSKLSNSQVTCRCCSDSD